MEFKAEPYTLRLNFSWCNSALFNVEAIDNRAQQIKASSRNIARAFGFRWYNFIIVVNSMELSKEKN
jgi:hypothetical protein